MRQLVSAIAFSALALSLSACEEIRTLEIPADKEIEVPGTGVGVGNNPLAPDQVFPVDFGQVLSDSLQQSFSTEGINPNAVESMKLTTRRAEVRDPEENGTNVRNLGFLTKMDFALAPEGGEGTLVAFSGEGAFDDDPIVFEWQLTDAELASIVQASDNLEMQTDVEIERRPTFATTIEFEAIMTVVVDPFGAI